MVAVFKSLQAASLLLIYISVKTNSLFFKTEFGKSLIKCKIILYILKLLLKQSAQRGKKHVCRKKKNKNILFKDYPNQSSVTNNSCHKRQDKLYFSGCLSM